MTTFLALFDLFSIFYYFQISGYNGNVKRNPNHVFLPDALTSKNKIILPEVEKANRDFGAQSMPKIMEQIIGPKAAPPLMGNGSLSGLEVIVKLVPSTASNSDDAIIEAEAVTLVHCKMVKTEEDRDLFKNLKMSPVYWREFRVKKSEAKSPSSPSNFCSHPLQSMWHSHLMSMTMVFTSLMEAYIYHLPGHIRKPGRGLGKILVNATFSCQITQPGYLYHNISM